MLVTKMAKTVTNILKLSPTQFVSNILFEAPNLKNHTSVTFKYELIEPLLIFTICYVSYLVAEMMELSAILAIIFCAFVMMHRVDKRLSKDSHVVIRNGLKEPHFPNNLTHTVWVTSHTVWLKLYDQTSCG